MPPGKLILTPKDVSIRMPNMGGMPGMKTPTIVNQRLQQTILRNGRTDPNVENAIRNSELNTANSLGINQIGGDSGGSVVLTGSGGFGGSIPSPSFRLPGGTPPKGPGFTSDRNEIWPHYPKRGLVHNTLPILADVFSAAYMAFRACTVVAVGINSPASLPIALGFYGAELFNAIHSFGFQWDTLNEAKYEAKKREHWPSEQQIVDQLGPKGERTMIENASAPEGAATIYPTISKTMEIEGNKQTVLCSQANLGPNKGKNGKEKNYRMKEELVSEVNKEYKSVWDFIRKAVGGGSSTTDTTGWKVSGKEAQDRANVGGGWNSLSIDGKKRALSSIYKMLSRRFTTRGGLYIWSGVNTDDYPNHAVMTEMLRRLFYQKGKETGELVNCGEISEVGLAREVDISQYGFTGPNGETLQYGENLDALADKVRSEMMTLCRTPEESLLFGFDYFKKITTEEKNETMTDYAESILGKTKGLSKQQRKDHLSQIEALLERGDVATANVIMRKVTGEPGLDISYFPKNVRTGGEDIKMGLEYEARMVETVNMDESMLDEEFGHLMNTYANHEIEWWDRDRLADQDHGGRKANSMNSLILHAGGKWAKIQQSGTDHGALDNKGYIVAQDTYSALMRTFIETFENGQEAWDAISPHLGDLRDAKLTSAADIKQRLTELINNYGGAKKPRRFVIPSDFLAKLRQKGFFMTPMRIKQTLIEEGFIDQGHKISGLSLFSLSMRMGQAFTRQEKMKELRMFFAANKDVLNFQPTDSQLIKLSETAVKDTEVPAGWEVTHEYDFSNTRFFMNIDAEAIPRPETLEQMVPYFVNLINKAKAKGDKLIPAVLQGPQFYVIDPLRSDKVHVVAMKDQRLFYQKIQPSKDVNKASFSCGSGVMYDLSPMRQISDVEVLDPTEPAKKQEPGGWSQLLFGNEAFRKDMSGVSRPVVTFIPPETPVEDFEFSFKAMLKKKYYTAFQDKLLFKGEAPKDRKNHLGAQIPKWAATLGAFFYRWLPAALRWMVVPTLIAKVIVFAMNLPVISQALGVVKVIGNGIDMLIKKNETWVKKLEKPSKMENPSVLYRAGYALAKTQDFIFNKTFGFIFRSIPYAIPKYLNHLTLDISMSDRPKMNPFTKAGWEFFRASSWYFNGAANGTLGVTGPSYVSALALTHLGLNQSQVVIDAFTAMTANILTTLTFLVPALGAQMGSYLYEENRLGRNVKTVMWDKEAYFQEGSWPGLIDATLFSVRGPSGRPGGTTDKGAVGRDILPAKYNIPAVGMTLFNALATATGIYFIVNGCSNLGLDIYSKLGGGGMMAVAFWTLYRSILGVRGNVIGYGGDVNSAKSLEKKLKNRKFYQGENIRELQPFVDKTPKVQGGN